MIPTFFPKPVAHLRNSRETTQSLQVDAQNGGRKTALIMLENGDMKGRRSYIYTQHSLRVTIIGTRGQAMTDGNVMTWRKICRAVTFGRFMSVNLCNALRLFSGTSCN